jgi:hypothetical protein
LQRVTAERDKTLATIAELQSKRDALDVEADDYAKERRAFDEYIAVQEGILRIVNDQAARLEIKVADEERSAAAARRAAAIKAVESMLPERVKIVEQIEAAVKSLPGLFEKLEAWHAKFIKQYPAADVEYPHAHYLDGDPILRHVQAALRTIRIEDVHEGIDGLAADAVKQHAELIADLQQNPAPKEDIAA